MTPAPDSWMLWADAAARQIATEVSPDFRGKNWQLKPACRTSQVGQRPPQNNNKRRRILQEQKCCRGTTGIPPAGVGQHPARPRDADDFNTYMFPLLFFKRICDFWDEECAEIVTDTGDGELALFPESHRFHIPNSVQLARTSLWRRRPLFFASLVARVAHLHSDVQRCSDVAGRASNIEGRIQQGFFDGAGLAHGAENSIDSVLMHDR